MPLSRQATSRVLALRVLLAGALVASIGAAALTTALGLSHPVASMTLPWPLLVLLFVAVEASVLHVQVRREAQTISMSEIPLVLGLFLADPAVVVATRVVGSGLVYVFYRRQAPLKVTFNLSLAFAEVSLALAVFHAVSGSSDAVSPMSWLATYLAVLASSSFSAVVVTTVIYLYEGGLRLKDLGSALATGLPIAVLTATVGLIATNCLILDTETAWLLGFAALLGVVAYRAYASLVGRHLSLERLYRFSQVVGSHPEVEGVVQSVLAQARDLLHAERAELLLLAAGDAGGLRMSYDGERLVRQDADEIAPASWLWRRVVHAASPVLVARTSRHGQGREYLSARGFREAIVAPLHGVSGVVGAVVVADRMGSVRSFALSDVRLLETVANHASVALENGRLVDRLRHDARHDALTGLPNRAYLEAQLVEALSRHRSGRSPGVTLLLMDLDGFKEVNDTLGHLHGDLLLREVGERLIATVPPGALVARLGGDEFAVLIVDSDDEAGALEIGRAVRKALEAPATVEDVQLEVGGSIGIAVAPLHGTDVGTLLKRADVAMYAAKGSGRGVLAYRPELDDNEPAKLVLATELRAALANDEIEVHAQPKARLSNGEVVGVELLLRWRHPTRGMVSPDDFIPVAERTGLLRPLTATVLGEGLAACARWGRAGHRLSVAVNLSTRSLLDPDLVDDVLAVLALHHVDPGQLTLEITEGSVMNDLAGTTLVLERLHAAGVRLSVDDFGTGYSSLSYLSRLPVDEVKIDKHFVLGMAADEQDAAIVQSVIDLGANLGLDVVAEGVEDAATWDRLVTLGCDVAQGWYLGRAMPLEELLPWLVARAERRSVPTQASADLLPAPVQPGRLRALPAVPPALAERRLG